MSQTNNDQSTTLQSLKDTMSVFVAERSWEIFHNPKNLATSICIEAAELAEHFQWLTADQSIAATNSIGNDHPIAQEIADVFAYVLALANATGIDLAAAFHAKMSLNAIKYPTPGAMDALSNGADESRFPNMDGG
jgi:dCTP diphosphatase